MKKIPLVIITSLLLIVVMNATVKAALIFDNGGIGIPTGGNPGAIVAAVATDDFILSNNSIVYGATLGLYGAHVDTWDTFGEWGIFSDSNGMPGTLLAFGQTSNNNASGGNYGDLHFDLGQNISLAKDTTYWFAFHALNVEPQYAVGIGYGIVPNNFGNTNKVYSLGYGSDAYIPVMGNMSNLTEWQTVGNGFDMAFQLHGNAVPLPGSIFLFSSGIVGLAASRFRIKKK